MRKIISYSLWGNNPKYLVGAQKNIELAKKFFPDWTVRIYVDESTDFNYESNNLEIFRRKLVQEYDGEFWRFEPCDSKDIVIVRDLDDRLSDRHRFVVDEWLNSDKDFHIIKDHPNHVFPIMAGLWGCRRGIVEGLTNYINMWQNKNHYLSDQYFLSNILSDKLLEASFIHDSFHNRFGIEKKISIKRENYEFLGDTYDENDERYESYWKIIKQYEEKN